MRKSLVVKIYLLYVVNKKWKNRQIRAGLFDKRKVFYLSSQLNQFVFHSHSYQFCCIAYLQPAHHISAVVIDRSDA